MSKITSLMTSLHEGHKTEERLMCIDTMLFKKCEDTKYTILQAFWWYRKHSVPLAEVKQTREEIEGKAFTEEIFDEDIFDSTNTESVSRETAECESYVETEVVRLSDVLEILDKLIESEDKK